VNELQDIQYKPCEGDMIPLAPHATGMKENHEQ
jgi:hypothetical protein